MEQEGDDKDKGFDEAYENLINIKEEERKKKKRERKKRAKVKKSMYKRAKIGGNPIDDNSYNSGSDSDDSFNKLPRRTPQKGRDPMFGRGMGTAYLDQLMMSTYASQPIRQGLIVPEIVEIDIQITNPMANINVKKTAEADQDQDDRKKRKQDIEEKNRSQKEEMRNDDNNSEYFDNDNNNNNRRSTNQSKRWADYSSDEEEKNSRENVQVKLSPNIVIVDIETQSAKFGESASQISQNIEENFVQLRLNYNQLKNIRHNLVASCFLGTIDSTDMEISMIEELNTEDDYMTPDYIKDYGDFWGVVEFTTNYIDGKLEDEFRRKEDKYSRVLTLRTDLKPILFCIICVGRKRILSNLNFSQKYSLILDIGAHWTLGEQITYAAMKQGIRFDEDDRDAEEKEMLWQSIRKAATCEDCYNKGEESCYHCLSSEGKYIISPEIIQHWNENQPTDEDEKFIAAQIWNKATAELKKDASLDSLKADLDKFYKRQKDYFGKAGVNPKTNPKPICYLPLFIPRKEITSIPDEEYYRVIPANFPNVDKWPFRLWYKAFYQSKTYNETYHYLTEEELLARSEIVKDVEQITPNFIEPGEADPLRNKRGRVGLHLSDLDRYQMLKRGVQGKRMKDTDIARENAYEQKSPFDMSVKTEDIDKFINESIFDLMQHNTATWDVVMNVARPLHDMARMNADGGNRKARSFITNFYNTKLGSALGLMDLILQEVNASLNQFCTTDEFVLKKLKQYPVWLLLKPTSASRKISVSICTERKFCENYFGPIGQVYEEQDWYVTDFFTLERHRLAHYLNTPQLMALSLSMWCEMYSVHPDMFWLNINIHKEVLKHFAATFLIHMESKPQTSAMLQNIRYAYMEVIKGNNLPLNPYKILDKFPENPRSRLCVWAMTNFIRSFIIMAKTPPTALNPNTDEFAEKLKQNSEISKDEMDEILLNPMFNVSCDNWKGLISWITLKEVPSYKVALVLSYMGCLHNKDEGDEMQGFLQIYEKIATEEMELRNTRAKHVGWEEEASGNYRDHEFSFKFVTIIGRDIRKNLERKFGGNFEGYLRRRFEQEHIMRTAFYFATYKASAVMQEKDTYDDSLKRNDRRKVLEMVVKYLRDVPNEQKIGNRPFAWIHRVIDLVENKGGVRVNLFKKQQLTGPREIFVLEFLDRIMINFIETLARCICEQLDIDMTTKGDQKMAKSDSHFRKVYARKKENPNLKVVTSIDSNDCTTWAQRFMMRVFACFYKPILPDNLFVILCRTLNQITNKKLELPFALLKKFKEKHEAKFDSTRPGTKEIKDQFLGRSRFNDLIEKEFGIYMTNESNMCQGILHVISGGLHTGVALWCNSKVKQKLRTWREAGVFEVPEIDIIQTSKTTSDDIANLRSLVYSGKWNPKMHVFLLITSYFIKNTYPYTTIKLSEVKSTMACMNMIEEFNSVWFISNTIVMPIIKFVYAATRTVVTSRLDDRQLVFANFRKQIVENGGSHFLADVAQEVQFDIHYKNLGATLHRLFHRYVTELMQKPHPALGFFLFEPGKVCGLFGYDLSHYLFVKNNSLGAKMESWLIRREGAEVNELGKPTVTFTLLIGGAKSYLGFKKRLRIPSDWKDILKGDGMLLYRRPASNEESLFFIYKKALTPSSADAFSFQAGSKLNAAAVYILHTPSITVRTKGKDETILQKFSLLGYLRRLEFDGVTITQNMIEVMHPNHEMYDYVESLVLQDNPYTMIPIAFEKPSKLHVMKFTRHQKMCSLSLKEVCLFRWWGKKLRGTKVEHNNCWAVYQQLYPWLDVKIEKTVEQSPFKDELGLSDFVKSHDPSLRSLKVLAPVRKGMTFETTIKHLMRDNYIRGFRSQYMDSSRASRGNNKSESDTDSDSSDNDEDKGDLDYNSGVSKKREKEKRIGKKTQKIHPRAIATAKSVALSSRLMVISRCQILSLDERSTFGREIIVKSEPILRDKLSEAITTVTTLPDRESKLACIQWYLRADASPEGRIKKKAQFQVLLENAKRGVFGFFTKTQTFNLYEKKFMGTGSFSANVDNTPVIINMVDDMLVEVLTTHPEQLRVLKEEMRNLFVELGLKKAKPETKIGQKELWHMHVNGSLTGTYIEGYTVPVRVIENLGNIALETSKIGFEVSELGKVRLYYKVSEFTKVTLLAFSPVVWQFRSDTDFNVILGSSKEHIDSWVFFREADANHMINVINTLRKNLGENQEFGTMPELKPEKPVDKRNVAIREWLKTTFMNRMQYRWKPPLSIISSSEYVSDEELEEGEKEYEEEDMLLEEREEKERDLVEEMNEIAIIGSELFEEYELPDDDEYDEDKETEFTRSRVWDEEAASLSLFKSTTSEIGNITEGVDVTMFNKEPEAKIYTKIPIDSIHPYWDKFIYLLQEREKLYIDIVYSKFRVITTTIIGKLIQWLLKTDLNPVRVESASEEPSVIDL